MVAGIIAAAFDNDAATTGRSLGISGANPLAVVEAVPWRFDGGNQDFAATIEIVDQLIVRKETGVTPNLA
jgi:hypothetical protein